MVVGLGLGPLVRLGLGRQLGLGRRLGWLRLLRRRSLLRRRIRLSLLRLWQRVRRGVSESVRSVWVRSIRKQQPIQSRRVATTIVTSWLLQWIHRWSPWARNSSRNSRLRAKTRRRRLSGSFRLKSRNNLSV